MDDRVRYAGFIADSARWDGFSHRDDDIVISTPSKSGTTWMQMLVALLVFDGPDFPRPLNEMSLWLDVNIRPLAEVTAALQGQQHRRFIKTHVPLDGLPLDDRVTYLVVGRDPRDVFASMVHHSDNIDSDHIRRLRHQVVGEPGIDDSKVREWPEDRSRWLRFALSLDRGSDPGAATPAHVFHHLQTAWERRHQPNVALFHYVDLMADLPGQMARLAGLLGLEVSDDDIARLAGEATLGRMRERADLVVPEATTNIWQDTAKFFRRGGSGSWREFARPGDDARYREWVAQEVERDLAHWAHHGWLG